MKIVLKATHPEKETSSCLIVGVYQDKTLTPAAKKLDKATNNCISKLLEKEAFLGKTGQPQSLFHVGSAEFDHILLVGCGKSKKTSPMDFRKIVLAAKKSLLATNVPSAICYLTELEVEGQNHAWQAKQIAEVAWDALYRFDTYKTEKDPIVVLKELVIQLIDNKEQAACEKAIQQGVAIANGMTLTKHLSNTPSNICTPNYLAEQAKVLTKKHPSLNVRILEEDEMRKLGMGALLAVSQGSAEDAKLICLEYKAGPKTQKPIALIGKGITFDTGGNSLKPAESMVGMKYDMCGAASVLGTMQAAAELELPLNIVGIIAAVENMPGGTAYKPEDILVSMSGQTIEVISTDAEGRLVLADALTYCERYEPEAVIDIATLTGAAIIALGFHTTGLIANNDSLAQELIKAGTESCDRAWQLPLFDEYQEQIKSPFADMCNSGGRAAGTITAGCFLSRFAKKFRWAHLDVAGTAAMMMGTSERRATGRPVPLLVQYLIDRTGN